MNKKLILGIVALVLVGGGIAGVARAYSSPDPKSSFFRVFIENFYGTYNEAQDPKTSQDIQLGGTTNFNDLVVDSLTTGSLTTTASLVSSGTLTVTGTTTIGFTPNQPNAPQTTMNTVTTTNCAVQNTTGVDRYISEHYLLMAAGSSANTANTQWRGYVSAARADGNTAATATLFKQAFIASSSANVAYGGPVPTSYLVTSSASVYITAANTPTTTLVLWPNSWWANVTSSAITTSTGACVFNYLSF